ncbi:MAG: hypothetical protein WBF33_25425 [Candidatus Nitrosopolaris sp.]
MKNQKTEGYEINELNMWDDINKHGEEAGANQQIVNVIRDGCGRDCTKTWKRQTFEGPKYCLFCSGGIEK